MQSEAQIKKYNITKFFATKAPQRHKIFMVSKFKEIFMGGLQL